MTGFLKLSSPSLEAEGQGRTHALPSAPRRRFWLWMVGQARTFAATRFAGASRPFSACRGMFGGPGSACRGKAGYVCRIGGERL